MFTTLRQHWHAFRADPPGQRFQRRYRRRNARRSGVWRKLLVIGGGLALLAIGIVMLVLPGPGLLVILIGALLIAEESLFASQRFDRIDAWYSRRRARRRGEA
jgi:hypothetical protein